MGDLARIAADVGALVGILGILGILWRIAAGVRDQQTATVRTAEAVTEMKTEVRAVGAKVDRVVADHEGMKKTQERQESNVAKLGDNVGEIRIDLAALKAKDEVERMYAEKQARERTRGPE